MAEMSKLEQLKMKAMLTGIRSFLTPEKIIGFTDNQLPRVTLLLSEFINKEYGSRRLEGEGDLIPAVFTRNGEIFIFCLAPNKTYSEFRKVAHFALKDYTAKIDSELISTLLKEHL